MTERSTHKVMRPNFIFITVEHDVTTKRFHAKLPYAGRDEANGATGDSKEDAIRNLYAVMDSNVLICEERDDGMTMWMRPPPAGPPLLIENLK